nr:hypothetical protein [Candidatus Freyarchaeota archaeon]
MDNLDKSNAVEVNCVRDEYIFISQQPCENCSRKNAYRLRTQTLIGREDRNYDVLDTECQFCGYKKCFTFDVTDCFQNLEKQFSATFKDRDKHEDMDWDKET